MRYAQGASGDVFVFVEGGSPGGVFNRIEYPALEANPNVDVRNIQYSPQVEYVNNINSAIIAEQ